MEIGTDLGIAAALYSVAAQENINFILGGVSFRTEGVVPLDWNYLDGKYLKSIMKEFGTVKCLKNGLQNNQVLILILKNFFIIHS